MYLTAVARSDKGEEWKVEGGDDWYDLHVSYLLVYQ